MLPWEGATNPGCRVSPHDTLPIMSLKNAAFLALIGTILSTVLLGYDFITACLNVMRGLIPAVTIFAALIYAFVSLTLAVFFFVFYKRS